MTPPSPHPHPHPHPLPISVDSITASFPTSTSLSSGSGSGSGSRGSAGSTSTAGAGGGRAGGGGDGDGDVAGVPMDFPSQDGEDGHVDVVSGSRGDDDDVVGGGGGGGGGVGEGASVDPLTRYSESLAEYTKKLYVDARFKHDRLERARARGGKAGTSGIERMGQKTSTART